MFGNLNKHTMLFIYLYVWLFTIIQNSIYITLVRVDAGDEDDTQLLSFPYHVYTVKCALKTQLGGCLQALALSSACAYRQRHYIIHSSKINHNFRITP